MSSSETSGWGRSRRATIVAWVLFAAVSLFWVNQIGRDDFRHHPVIGDASAYLLQAESLGYAGHDLRYDQRDLDYYRSFAWADDPYGLYFQRDGDGWAFAKPYGYSVVLAPALRIFGVRRGVQAANLALFAVIGVIGAAMLRLRFRGAVVPVALGAFLYGSPLVFYAFHVWVELFTAALVAATSYALVRASRDRSIPWAAAGFALAGFLLAEKAPALPLVGPLLVVVLAGLPGRRRRVAVALVGLVVLGLATVPYRMASDGRASNPYGGERYYAKSGVPFEDPPRPLDSTGHPRWGRVTSDETFSIGYARAELLRDGRDKAASAATTVVGRHTGLLPFTPMALFLLLAALAATPRLVRRRAWLPLAVLAGLLGYLAFYVLLFPHNYNGGGQTFGNRYVVQVYPMVLLLPALIPLRAKVLAAGSAISAAVALAFLWPHYTDAQHALADIDRTGALQRLLPFEANQDGADYFRCGIARCPADPGS